MTRELWEETGVTATAIRPSTFHEVIARGNDGALLAHYVIAVYCGCWLAGEARASSDAAAARFVSQSNLAGYPLTDGLADIVNRIANNSIHSCL